MFLSSSHILIRFIEHTWSSFIIRNTQSCSTGRELQLCVLHVHNLLLCLEQDWLHCAADFKHGWQSRASTQETWLYFSDSLILGLINTSGVCLSLSLQTSGCVNAGKANTLNLQVVVKIHYWVFPCVMLADSITGRLGAKILWWTTTWERSCNG